MLYAGPLYLAVTMLSRPARVHAIGTGGRAPLRRYTEREPVMQQLYTGRIKFV
jgi:hypothetical protein